MRVTRTPPGTIVQCERCFWCGTEPQCWTSGLGLVCPRCGDQWAVTEFRPPAAGQACEARLEHIDDCYAYCRQPAGHQGPHRGRTIYSRKPFEWEG